ncbi:MAG: hypothetical protein CVT99_09965 [Bacteroidetes bacterium HGW-Bacteroidetes-16]|nr:MAG: hypothetical protein CVT99_09965 [Bacteroidetes bacterium HGW-Bacteroidetes-16]
MKQKYQNFKNDNSIFGLQAEVIVNQSTKKLTLLISNDIGADLPIEGRSQSCLLGDISSAKSGFRYDRSVLWVLSSYYVCPPFPGVFLHKMTEMTDIPGFASCFL